MSELVERVARAICKSRFMNGGNEDDDGWDDLPKAHKQQRLIEARAAIEAMREPTEAMIDAGEPEFYEWMFGQEDWTRPMVPQGWRAMIDAALTDIPRPSRLASDAE